MDLRQLRYFVAIVEHGSVSRAAEALRVAQPALSQHLRNLENDLGCSLMLRTSRGVVPTESGRRLAQRAEVLLQQVNALRDEVRGLEASPIGPASVGIPTSLGPRLTVPLAVAVRRLYPQIHLRVVEGLSGHMLDWVQADEVDMALVFGVEAVPGLTSTFIARETLSLIAPLGDPLLSGQDTVTVDEILDLPLILPSRPHGVREEVEQAAQAMQRTPNVIMDIDALEQIKALVAEGVGYAVLSDRVARGGPLVGRLSRYPIVSPKIERRIFLAHASTRPLSLAAQAVRGQMQTLLAARTHDGVWDPAE